MMVLVEILWLLCSLAAFSAEQTSRQPPKDLLVMVVATNTNHDGYVQFLHSVEKHKLQLQTVGAGLEWSGGDIATKPGGGQKVNLLRKAMEEHKDKDDLAVLITDSYDAVMHGNKDSILDAFKQFDAGVVFSAEVFIWPDHTLAVKYPPVRTGESRYLNSGGYIGYAADIYKLLTNHEIKDSDDDQLYFTNLFIDEYQAALRGGNKYTENTAPTVTPVEALKTMNIKLDTRSIIFQTLNGVLDQVEIKYKDKHSYLQNMGTGSKPLVIHGNGPIKHKFNKMVSYLNDAWMPSDGCLACKLNRIDISEEEKLPVIFMSLCVEESTPFLPHWLDRIEKLSYPKNKLEVIVHNRMPYHEKVMSQWVEDNKDAYKSLEFMSSEVTMTHAEAKNVILKKCIERECEYFLSIDSVAQLTKVDVIQDLLSFNRSSLTPLMVRPGYMFSTFWAAVNSEYYYNKGAHYTEIVKYEMQSLISPVMNRPGLAWSTFWAGVSRVHYYERAEEYDDIVNHKVMGVWNVPYTTGVQLIKGSKLSLLPTDPYSADSLFPPEDYDVAFAYNARKTGLMLSVVNMEYYGHLINPDNFDTSRAVPDLYELIDNRVDWEQYYLHKDFYSISVNETHPLEEPCTDVFWFPIFNDLFCDDLINVMETFGKWSGGTNQDTRLAGGYENVPTRDIHMNQVGLEKHWITILRSYVHPVQLKVYEGYHSTLQAHMNFVVRYRPDEQPSLRPHHDSSTFTVNMALNTRQKDYEGGGVRFIRYDCTLIDLRKGWMLIHPGRLTHYHEGLQTTNGTRYIMVSFVNP